VHVDVSSTEAIEAAVSQIVAETGRIDVIVNNAGILRDRVLWKAGIIGFTKTAAKELARFGVTVNAISPNAETRMVASIPADKKAELAAGIPMGRFGDAAEMCAAVGFLASREAGYITGAVLPVDGGLSI
jgi:NAD(P)-dependent dehydrogenase (short-subunit alcohol dehydrogenase family)